MKIVNNIQMREIDRIAINEYKMPGIILMENAGVSVANEIIEHIDLNSTVAIFCGTGNNGGDGFVVARQLFQRSIRVYIVVVGDELSIMGDAATNYIIAKQMEIPMLNINDIDKINKLNETVDNATIIVDGIFGTGFNGEIQGVFKDVIEYINATGKEVISIDIPSGVDGDNGSAKVAVKANKTIALQLPKIGNVVYPGAELCGELIIKDIGIPLKIIKELDNKINLMLEENINLNILRRKANTHKGNFGTALIIAGSMGMSGAAILASQACLRSGVGLLRIATPFEISQIVEGNVIEGITIHLNKNYEEVLLKELNICSSIAIGPGIGKSKEAKSYLNIVLKNRKKERPTILDADALNILCEDPDLVNLLDENCVLTPHPGEMARLTGLSVEEINENRIGIAEKYSKKWNTNIVLKGARTIISDNNGIIYINTTGNPGMATAGSGDVLTGMITAFTARGIPMLEAIKVSVFLHGKAGDRGADIVGQNGLIASDIIKEIPKVIDF